MALNGAMVQGRQISLAAQTAILDSGTTAILVSARDGAAIHNVWLPQGSFGCILYGGHRCPLHVASRSNCPFWDLCFNFDAVMREGLPSSRGLYCDFRVCRAFLGLSMTARAGSTE